MKIKFFLVVISIFYSSVVFADTEEAKKNIINRFTSSLSNALQNMIGGEGGGDTEVQISASEEAHPTFSIMTVRPLATHPGVDAWFVQLQLNDTKVRGKNRLAANTGLGYRKLSEDKNSFIGGNLFFDYDEEGHTRTSVGFEMRASAFEAIANYYIALSSAETVGDYTERSLDGLEVSVVGEVPYLPWASIIASHYEWQAEKNSKDSKGEKISLELLMSPNFIFEAGYDDNNISGYNEFVKMYFVFPARQRAAASTNLVGDTAFSSGDMSLELLSKVRRTNTQIIESEGTGIVIGRASE